MDVNLTVPWPPTVNHYWVQTKKGWFISDRGKKFREIVNVISLCKKLKNYYNEKDRLCLKIEAYPPDNRRRDIDNILKSLLDSFQHAGIYPDDNQIDVITIERKKENKGLLNVTLSLNYQGMSSS